MTENDDLPVSQVVSDGYRLIAAPDGLSPEQRDRMISERSQPQNMEINRTRYRCHVAEDNGRVVGFIAISGGNIEELFVSPDHHRRGVATALFRVAEASAAGAVLTVSTTGYGIPFYEAMGMSISGRRLVTLGPLEGRELVQLSKGVSPA